MRSVLPHGQTGNTRTQETDPSTRPDGVAGPSLPTPSVTSPAQHTPGPWVLDGHGHVYAEAFRRPAPFTAADGTEYADHTTGLVALPYSCGDAEAIANARLIAAAPDMREALGITQRTVRGTWADGFTIYVTGHEMDAIRAAIAKAEGR